MPQRDSTEDMIIYCDPPVHALLVVGKSSHPGREPAGRRDRVTGEQPKTVFVQAWTPLSVCLEPSGVPTSSGDGQGRHAETLYLAVVRATAKSTFSAKLSARVIGES